MSQDLNFLQGYGVEFSSLVETAQSRTGQAGLKSELDRRLNSIGPSREGLASASLEDGMYLYAYPIPPLKRDNLRLWTEEELKEDLAKEIFQLLGSWLEASEIAEYVHEEYNYHFVEIY